MLRLRIAIVVLSCLALAPAGCKKRPPPPEGPRCSTSDADQKRLSACGSARDKESCVAAGGHWNNGHLEKTWACDCPSPKCWCEEEGDCAGTCFAPPPSSRSSCEGVVYGRCGATPRGCGCRLRDGKWQYMCVD